MGNLLFTMNYLLAITYAVLLMFGNCRKEPPQPSTIYKAEMMSRKDLETSFAAKPAQNVINPGKIYTKGNFIYLNEQYEGVHIIDNTDITKPNKIAFLQIKGCIDISIKGNFLYADNAVDLITLDISDANPMNVRIVKRNKSVFPEPVPPDLGYMPSYYTSAERSKDSIIVAWKKE